ncbi:MAG: chemotaxis protein CheW [Gammaproteobacteria bacterium]|nr:chemotaxis protein CheW [Gammaproteobacteria bacterium]
MSEATKKTADQEQAIHEYLESLLLEVPDEDSKEAVDIRENAVTSQLSDVLENETGRPLLEPEVKQPVVGLEHLVAEVPKIISEIKTQVKTDVQLEIKTETDVQIKTQSEEITKQIPDTGVPEWAETRFQCLMFNVSGLSLAVPLVKLNSVIPWDESITRTPNQTDWYLGLVQHLQNQIKVIDTALLVMPENRHKNLVDNASGRLSHILLVDDYKWGLACSSIGDVIWLNKDEVKWRKNKTSRAWLSGTSLEHLCAIMDTEVFAQMLTE